VLVVFGRLSVRLYAEVLIVVFRINETLSDLLEFAEWGADQAYEQLSSEPPPGDDSG
jgi:hypothetical protein